jgi:phage repressor protein C with HTH and peptisase S24 domain
MTGEHPSVDEMGMVKKYRKLDSFGKSAVDSVLNVEFDRMLSIQPKKQRARMLKFDFYNYPASAGTGNFLETETPEDIWVKEVAEAEDADYVIPISGDSMEPTYHSGDKVFVEKCSTIDVGEIGIFVVNGEAYIKELGEKCLISHNSAYKPIKLGASDSVYCCGRVLGVVEE